MNDGRIIQTKEEAKRKAEEKKNQVGIVFINVNTGEERTASTSEHIAAFFNSSDLGPNAKNHQDFGWRLSPETVAEMELLKENEAVMAQIAAVYQIPPDEVADYNVLKYIADRRFRDAARASREEGKDYRSDYEKAVAEAREKARKSSEKEVAEKPEKADNTGNAK